MFLVWNADAFDVRIESLETHVRVMSVKEVFGAFFHFEISIVFEATIVDQDESWFGNILNVLIGALCSNNQ